jgi:hypothetical protein
MHEFSIFRSGLGHDLGEELCQLPACRRQHPSTANPSFRVCLVLFSYSSFPNLRLMLAAFGLMLGANYAFRNFASKYASFSIIWVYVFPPSP